MPVLFRGPRLLFRRNTSGLDNDFTERVGLRYLDRVAPVGDDQLSEYLVQEVLGVSGRLGGKPLRSFSEAFNEFGDIKLLSM
ncbi:MAG: hypothetical protein QOI16_3885 [Pseudonocardiales bacterium]|nr:hypothetical protein [Pseudonocardiales bacterium]